jgi:hypothetical protein
MPRSARAVRLEFKRSAVPYLLPLLAAVFYFNTVRTADGYPPVWTVRSSVIENQMLFEFSAFAAGLAAWAGSREGRRKTVDLMASTPRAVWARRAFTLAGTLGWLLLAFLAGVAVLYVQTALQATWGGPPLWPVIVGVAGVTASAVLGFTAGVFFPGRFTAPLVAILVFVLTQVGFRQALGMTPGTSSTYAVLSPFRSGPLVDAGVYYRVAPDVSIVQVMFMGGIAVALFGVLGLAGLRRAAADGRVVRAVALALVACGVAASAAAFSLAGTARPDPVAGTGSTGVALDWEIPALYSAASDQPLPVRQDCTSGAGSLVAPGAQSQQTAGSGFQTCVHPAFEFDLDAVAGALAPAAAEIAGLPGAPVRAQEVASVSGGQQVQSGISGSPPVFQFSAEHVGTMFGEFIGIGTAAGWSQPFQQGLFDAFLGSPHPAGQPAFLDPAQQAVEDALLAAIGTKPLYGGPVVNGQPAGASPAISAAAQRLESLSASARHAWLAAHLPALRAGSVTLAQLP